MFITTTSHKSQRVGKPGCPSTDKCKYIYLVHKYIHNRYIYMVYTHSGTSLSHNKERLLMRVATWKRDAKWKKTTCHVTPFVRSVHSRWSYADKTQWLSEVRQSARKGEWSRVGTGHLGDDETLLQLTVIIAKLCNTPKTTDLRKLREVNSTVCEHLTATGIKHNPQAQDRRLNHD